MRQLPPFVWYLLGMVFGTGNAMIHLAQNQALKLYGVAMIALSMIMIIEAVTASKKDKP